MSGRLNIPFSIEASSNNIIPPEVQVALYYLCKEALNIITQRAKAQKVKIEVIGDRSKTEIHIVEDGDIIEKSFPASIKNNDFQSAFTNAEASSVSLEIKPPKDGSGEVVILWKRKLL